MSTNAIARRYAKALVQLAAEEQQVEQIYGELARCDEILTQPVLTSVLENPAYGIEEKRAILKDVLGKHTLSKTVSNFLMLMLDKGRIGYLSAAIAAYRAYADEISGVIRPLICSATPLAAEQLQGIQDALTKSTGKTVILSEQIDPALIGGVVTKIGDMVYDGSIRTQLNQLEGILQKG